MLIIYYYSYTLQLSFGKLVKQEIELSSLVLQEDEVSDVKWATVDEIRNLMKSGKLAKSIDIYFDMFIELLSYPF